MRNGTPVFRADYFRSQGAHITAYGQTPREAARAVMVICKQKGLRPKSLHIQFGMDDDGFFSFRLMQDWRAKVAPVDIDTLPDTPAQVWAARESAAI